MAKLSQINRNKKREKMVGAVCRQARGAQGEGRGHDGPARRAFRRASQAGQAAAQFVQGCASIIAANCPAVQGFYRKVKLSRIALRSLGNFGQIPGMTKASW